MRIATVPTYLREQIAARSGRECICACGARGAYLCDARVPPARCDAYVCEDCAASPKPGIHLCPAHHGLAGRSA